MSQNNVERVIGRLVTDEEFRFAFFRDPESTLRALAERGIELNECERHALRAIDERMISFVADSIDPSLQKSDLRKGTSGGMK